VLSNGTYQDHARKLQQAIAEANGLSVAADLVEESLGLTEKDRQRGLRRRLAGLWLVAWAVSVCAL